MILFPESIVSGLIVGALCLTGIAIVSLIAMIIKDYLTKDVW
ncbi:hypothetical protein [Pelagicoccus sp. SDUM812003]|nr:hypothetical protein [Pelagicoccus sp. SDUM812003]MDQ8202898.1 hypothetical protein [Pelagicoccus sp. SDUM812003]